MSGRTDNLLARQEFEIDCLITDSGASDEATAPFQQLGIEGIGT
jgi:hypothetical protein